MEITTIGLDIAKRVFQLHGVDGAGKAVWRRKLQRSEVLAFFKALPPCLVGIEACGTAHYWAREIRELGHEVRLMPPSYVAPYVKRGKTDAADAAAICEAVTRPTMRFVPIKQRHPGNGGPSQKFLGRPVIGPPGVRVADVGGEEFEETHRRALAGGNDDCWQLWRADRDELAHLFVHSNNSASMIFRLCCSIPRFASSFLVSLKCSA